MEESSEEERSNIKEDNIATGRAKRIIKAPTMDDHVYYDKKHKR